VAPPEPLVFSSGVTFGGTISTGLFAFGEPPGSGVVGVLPRLGVDGFTLPLGGVVLWIGCEGWVGCAGWDGCVGWDG
jgi:hypothetical protein